MTLDPSLTSSAVNHLPPLPLSCRTIANVSFHYLRLAAGVCSSRAGRTTDEDGNLFLNSAGIELIKTYESHGPDALQEMFDTEGVRLAARWCNFSQAVMHTCSRQASIAPHNLTAASPCFRVHLSHCNPQLSPWLTVHAHPSHAHMYTHTHTHQQQQQQQRESC